jgi:hypothetical protein
MAAFLNTSIGLVSSGSGLFQAPMAGNDYYNDDNDNNDDDDDNDNHNEDTPTSK